MIAENPNKKGKLFVGTGNAFYYTLDDGAHWKQLQTGLPAAPVSWIVVQKRRTISCSPPTAAACTSWKTSRRWSRA